MFRRKKKKEEEQNETAALLKITEGLSKKVDVLSETMERSGFVYYAEYLRDKKGLFRRNFLSGIYRGLGTAIGVTILGAVLVYILQWIVRLNLPWIGEFLSDVVRMTDLYSGQ